MHHALIIMIAAVASATAGQESSPDPAFLDAIRVVDVDPEDGVLTFRAPEGEVRTLREGDVLEEVDGARVESVSRTTLVLKRVVRGGDGHEGEALIVVRFDGSGQTKVREYRTVPDVSPRTEHNPNHP